METSSPNQHGVYPKRQREIVARSGRAYAAISMVLCEDGLYRSSDELHYSNGGFTSPIMRSRPGHPTADAARLAAVEELLHDWPHPFPSDPISVQRELSELRRQVEAKLRQPTLF